jgi:hypothetical protein
MPTSMRPGHAVAALGAVVLAAALWLPWYEVHVPEALGRELGEATQTAPLLGQLMQELAAAIPADLTVTAWQAFDVADVFLAVACAHVLFVLVFGASSPGAAAKLALAAGCAAAGLVALKLASPPGPDGMLDVRHGAWVALLGALLIAAGGFLARDAPAAAAPPPAPPLAEHPPTGGTALPWDAGASTPPPGR